jgi:hypothetical protein
MTADQATAYLAAQKARTAAAAAEGQADAMGMRAAGGGIRRDAGEMMDGGLFTDYALPKTAMPPSGGPTLLQQFGPGDPKVRIGPDSSGKDDKPGSLLLRKPDQ